LNHPASSTIILVVGLILLWWITKDQPKAVVLYGANYHTPLPSKKHPVLQTSLLSVGAAFVATVCYIAYHITRPTSKTEEQAKLPVRIEEQQALASAAPEKQANARNSNNARVQAPTPSSFATPSNPPKAREPIAAAQAQASAVPSPSVNTLAGSEDVKVTVSGIVQKGEKPVVYITGGARLDSSIKLPGSVYVLVLVSRASRRSASIDQDKVQSIVNSVRKIAGVKVFFADGGLQISMAGSATGSNGLLGPELDNAQGSVFYFDHKVEQIALNLKAIVEALAIVKTCEYRLPSDHDIGIGASLQDAWKVAGVDIEVVL
jgi:hypothetical protein